MIRGNKRRRAFVRLRAQPHRLARSTIFNFMNPFKFALALAVTLPVAAPTVARAQNVVAIAGTSIPDVSVLQYHSVTIASSTRWPLPGKASEQTAHLWIVPARPDAATPSLGIGWDGVPYEVTSVGDKADWRADVETFLQNKDHVSPAPYGFAGRSVARQLLIQLGATDLQRKVGDQIKLFGRNNPQFDYLQNLRDAGVSSFASGQFSQAQMQLNKLLEVWPDKTPAGLDDLQLDAQQIIADIKRRAHNEPRPTDNIAGLIWDLQNVRAYQMSVPGGIMWTLDPTIMKLIDMGDLSVEPLLDTLENDNRLTLSTHLSNFRNGPGSIGTVRDAAQSALEVLLNHRYSATNYQASPALRAANVVAQMRADWNKVKGESPVDRVFNELNQTGQIIERLSEAARELVRTGTPYGFMQINPNLPRPKFFGEPLRARQNPSVSDVLEARINELTQRALNGKPTASALDPAAPDMTGGDPYALDSAMCVANELAVVYAKWEPERALPLLSAQLEKTKTFITKVSGGTDESAQRSLNRTRRQFLAARLNSPYRAEAMREYGAFLQAQPFGRVAQENYLPLWGFPDEPAMVEAAHALFDAPRKPFETAATWNTRSFNADSAFRLLSSPLVKTPIFRDAVLRALKNQTVIGNLVKAKDDEAELKVTASDWSGQTITLNGRKLENGDSQPMRVCDLVGFWLHEKLPDEDGHSRIGSQLDVALPTAQRDARLKQIAELVSQGHVVAESSGIWDIDWN